MLCVNLHLPFLRDNLTQMQGLLFSSVGIQVSEPLGKRIQVTKCSKRNEHYCQKQPTVST